jgi:SAM-dependent methyltransferase
LIQQSFLSLKLTQKYDAVGMFDVIEHQKDDLAFVKKARDLLKPGGLLFVTVPASQALWSRVDEISGHQRRYDIPELLDITTQAGLATLYANYWQCLAFPFYYIWQNLWKSKRTDDVAGFFRTPPVIINKLMYWLLMLEQTFMFIFRFPYGTSIIFVARKNKKNQNCLV